MPQNKRIPRKYQQREDNSMFDMYNIVKYFGLWILFSLIAFGIKTVVLSAISISPTSQVGNGILTLYEVHNTGAAFNLFAGQSEAIIMASLITVFILTIIVIIRSKKIPNSAVPAMAFLSTGITMNMLERIQYGYVIDYIHCDFLNNFPVFNVPDIMIVIGTICLILAILTRR